jgi:hypothetical protein
MRTLRGSGFFEPYAKAVRGSRLHGKEPGRFNAPSRGRAFSGGAAAQSGRRVGGGRDGPPRPFGCRVVMIAHARTPGCFGVVGPARR